MKKIVLIAIAAAGMMTAQAQQAIEAPSFWSNWSVGIDGGVTTPLANHHAFFGDMRGSFGAHIQKQISPAFALGVEGVFDVNTSSWVSANHAATAIDSHYLGAYGAVNLFNLFGGYKCDGRAFDMEVVGGAGWGRYYRAADVDFVSNYAYHNFFATKVGLNFNFNVTKNFTVSLKPSVIFNMSDANVAHTSAAYNKERASFDFHVGLTYHFGEGFKCVDPKNQAEIDALNAKINDLRSQLDACNAANADAQARAAQLAKELEACKNRKPEVVKEFVNNRDSERYVFFKVGSSKITADQQPNVEMVANYLKSHEGSKVTIKGYASPDGNLEFNKKLAAARAESVKNSLVKKYGIDESRISASGEGIGDMFSENDWNRVSICTLDK